VSDAVKDQVLALACIWAIYLAVRLIGEAVDILALPRLLASGSSPAATPAEAAPAKHPEAPRPWTPLPAVLWLAGEACVAAIVVGVAWWVVRVASPDLVPSVLSKGPADTRSVVVAAIVVWSLFVINVSVAMRLIDRLLPSESKKPSGGVDPERMGATIGVLERLLVVVLLPGGGATAVGFVVAAKTLARFKELNKKRFAERYLLGTMASVTVALLSSLAAQWFWASQI
jgi:hypothetical protein